MKSKFRKGDKVLYQKIHPATIIHVINYGDDPKIYYDIKFDPTPTNNCYSPNFIGTTTEDLIELDDQWESLVRRMYEIYES